MKKITFGIPDVDTAVHHTGRNAAANIIVSAGTDTDSSRLLQLRLDDSFLCYLIGIPKPDGAVLTTGHCRRPMEKEILKPYCVSRLDALELGASLPDFRNGPLYNL